MITRRAVSEDERVHLTGGIDHRQLQITIKRCGRGLPHGALPLFAGGSAIGLSATDAYGQSLGR